MARRKKPDEPEANGSTENGVPTTTNDPPTTPEAEQSTSEPSDQPPARREALGNRPAASFAAPSDRGTRIEVAVWSKQVKVGQSEEYTQYSLTLSRSWRDKEGNWFGNACFRVHDIPVLLYLVGQAYDWCVAQRTAVRIETIPELPF